LVAVLPGSGIIGICLIVGVALVVLVVRVRVGASVILRTGRHGGGLRLTAYNFGISVGRLRVAHS